MKNLLVLLPVFLLAVTVVRAEKPSDVGFSDAGYNEAGNIFNGTGWSWCMDKVSDETWCTNYLGAYANDSLIMKWNDEWNRGNDENWANPPYKAWLNNQWNGMGTDGSGSNWHYKYVWVGDCGADYTPLPNGGYCIWGQFAVLSDHGMDPSYGPGHMQFAHGIPNGYGAY